MILAIDPGNTRSAFVLFDPETQRIVRMADLENAAMMTKLREFKGYDHDNEHVLAIEMIASYGMAVGREVFDTCVWIGRFIEAWRWNALDVDKPWQRVYRQEVKLHLCGQARAKDANIRQALIDRFGPGKDKAIGTKKAPGPLFGVAGDVWAALAVAVTFADGAARAEAAAA